MKDISWITLASGLFIEVIKSKDKMKSFGPKLTRIYDQKWDLK